MDLFGITALLILVLMIIGTGFMSDERVASLPLFRKIYR